MSLAGETNRLRNDGTVPESETDCVAKSSHEGCEASSGEVRAGGWRVAGVKAREAGTAHAPVQDGRAIRVSNGDHEGYANRFHWRRYAAER